MKSYSDNTKDQQLGHIIWGATHWLLPSSEALVSHSGASETSASRRRRHCSSPPGPAAQLRPPNRLQAAAACRAASDATCSGPRDRRAVARDDVWRARQQLAGLLILAETGAGRLIVARVDGGQRQNRRSLSDTGDNWDWERHSENQGAYRRALGRLVQFRNYMPLWQMPQGFDVENDLLYVWTNFG